MMGTGMKKHHIIWESIVRCNSLSSLLAHDILSYFTGSVQTQSEITQGSKTTLGTLPPSQTMNVKHSVDEDDEPGNPLPLTQWSSSKGTYKLDKDKESQALIRVKCP